METAALPQDTKVQETNYDRRDYFDFGYAKGCFNRLIDSWSEIIEITDRERAIRYLKDTDSNTLRDRGILKADELYSPIHLIDTNIRAEQPSLVQYLTQSRRALIFASPSDVLVDGLEKLESDFTNKARYLGWETPFIKTFDGGPCHGWDSVEVIFDPEMPGNFAIEHIGHDSLIFAKDSEDLEAQEVIFRKINLTSKQLREFVVTDGFSEEIVEEVIKKKGNGEHGDECCHEVYKGWFKKEGCVYVFWYNKEAGDYLKAPVKLFLGRRDFTQPPQPEVDENGEMIVDEETGQPIVDFPALVEKKFPVILYRYTESSDPVIIETRGRAKLDEPAQEAASAIQTGLVNGVLRASNVYAAPANTNQNQHPNEAPKLTKTVLQNGGVYDQPITFFHTAYPEPAVIQALQTVITQNKQEQSQVNMSVMNRKDSGKTATEIQSANAKANELSTVQVILISIFVRTVYSRAWSIYQNRVLQGKIKVSQELAVLFGDQAVVDEEGFVVQSGRPKKYILKSSGDVDVIQRQEKAQKQMQAWPVIANTPLAQVFLEDILRSQFPEDAERYIATMQQAAMQKEQQLEGLVGQLANVVKALVLDEAGNVKPEYAEQAGQLQQLEANIQATLGAGGDPNQQQPTEPNPQGQPFEPVPARQ